MSTATKFVQSASLSSVLSASSSHVSKTPSLKPLIEVYTRPGCSYCVAAKKILAHNDLSFVEYDTARNYRRLATMRTHAPARTFPQIVINQKWIGGFEDLLAFDFTQHSQSNSAPLA
mgnify:CR=1 FL=1